MRKAMATWRSTLLRCLASTEAIIDFGEDEEISADVSLNVLQMAKQLRRHLQEHVSSSRQVVGLFAPSAASLSPVYVFGSYSGRGQNVLCTPGVQHVPLKPFQDKQLCRLIRMSALASDLCRLGCSRAFQYETLS